MEQSPYDRQPDFAFWRRAVANRVSAKVDPVVSFPFRFGRGAKVVTAGSCFAQHISARLVAHGFNYFVTEPGNPILKPDMKRRYNYGTYSARFGNIYSARQLRQLAERAYGRFAPKEDVWEAEGGRAIDPLRPAIQPGGFSSRAELLADRARHLAAVRRAFEELEIFIFTLGLTECWVSRADGLVFPVCPGVSGGMFSEERHEFLNFGVDDIVADLKAFFSLLFEVNPDCRAILTVSPVPLIATAERRHVLVSNSWSKAVLRVAAEVIVRENPNIAYFPSYEIVTGAFSRGRYFERDMRTVTNSGVDHVMRLFFQHATEIDAAGVATAPAGAAPRSAKMPNRRSIAKRIVRLVCDEEAIERDRR